MAPLVRLLKPQVPLWRYTLEAWSLALIPSLLLAVPAVGLVMLLGIPVESVTPSGIDISGRTIISAVVIGPVIETAVLCLVLTVLSRYLKGSILVASISAVIWGFMHGLFGVLWFFGTVWSFFVFPCAFLAWRRQSIRAAFIAAAVPRALVNLCVISAGMLDAA
jgi:hypothetical protein